MTLGIHEVWIPVDLLQLALMLSRSSRQHPIAPPSHFDWLFVGDTIKPRGKRATSPAVADLHWWENANEMINDAKWWATAIFGSGSYRTHRGCRTLLNLPAHFPSIGPSIPSLKIRSHCMATICALVSAMLFVETRKKFLGQPL